MIKIEDLSKIYSGSIAVDGISFEVKEGHIYGFLGPNGAGKSTTMNMITGYIAPTYGKIEINGCVMGKDTLKAKKNIGYLPEIPPLYPDMGVREYLSFVAGLKGLSKAEKKSEIDRVMKATSIEDVSTKLIKYLSKGYKQRVGIAQALLGNPKVIILDEPTVGLDPEQIIEIRELIKSLKGNHTVILSSHILSEISATCDEVLVICHGRMIACDTTENLLRSQEQKKILNLKVKGEKDKVEEILKGISDADNIELMEETEETVSFKLESAKDKDIRETVSFALSDARLLILEMNEELSSLEDVYLALVKEADEAYEKELQAIRDGVDLDEIFSDKKEEIIEETEAEASADNSDSAETEEKEAE